MAMNINAENVNSLM